jgi:hypothetical protein
MSCEEHVDAIGELVEGTLPPPARATLEAHLQECATCRGLVADLRRIRLAAQALPRLKAPEDGWALLSERLKREGMPAASTDTLASGRAPRLAWLRVPSSWLRPGPVLVAATLAIAVTASLLLLRTGSDSGPRATGPGGPAVASADRDVAQSVAEELRLAEQHYERAIAGLEQIAKAGEGTLDPQVAATLQKNLSVIDQAIQESRVALQSQPASQVAQESLFEAFRRKVGLLQETVALINEMRKGNQAGAAKILGNLDKS